ncbi:Sialin [Araneus ventricosus]|uniref:Sialin n=1 Tax=Araneus ventricosus TaxID=182803 RepID=A0A4Y2NEI0_ARAVE|nr:Sialin [Araneus ventricosus]
MGYQHWPANFSDEIKTPLLEKRIKKKSLRERIPARYVLTFLTFLGLGIQYTQRVNLNVTMVAMVNSTSIAVKENETLSDECPNIFSAANVTREYPEGKYTWSPSTQGVILGAFYYGYVFTPLLGGRLSELLGAKWLLGGGIFFTSLLTLITPMAAEWGIGVMVALRVIVGAAQGVNSASMYAMFSRWAPTHERSRLLSICTIGQHVGTIITMPTSGFLIQYNVGGGWPSVFYLFGLIGCLWFVFWVFLVYNTPAEHPRISKAELVYIQQHLPQTSAERKSGPPRADTGLGAKYWLTGPHTGMWGLILACVLPPWEFRLISGQKSFCWLPGHMTHYCRNLTSSHRL